MHRRLNVAVTRARHELMVFATLRPEQIDLGRTSISWNSPSKVHTGSLRLSRRPVATRISLRAHASPAILGMGGSQIGVSFFRLDLGIVHPDFPGRYLAGVECDGATYHRSATARHRDRLRELVLTDLGWRPAHLEHRMVARFVGCLCEAPRAS
jgi:hypothetical protein